MKRHLAYALAFTTLTAIPAFAQSVTTDFMTQAQTSDWRASKLAGVNIYGQDNQKIGDVNDVILGQDGSAKAVVIGVGGFLGIGEKNVAVPFSYVHWSAQPLPTTTAANGMMTNGTNATSGTGAVGSANTNAATNTTGANGIPAIADPANNTAAGTGSTVDGTASPTTTGTSMAANNTPVNVGTGNTAAMNTTSVDYPDHGMVNLTKDQLQNAPAFKYASDQR